MSHSSYNGQYVHYQPLHDENYILSFAKEQKIYSNQQKTDYMNHLKKLIAYEKKRNFGTEKGTKKQKVFAIQLTVMIPKDLSKSQKHETVRQFMMNVSMKYKHDILYIYSFITQGKGNYARIIAFQRQVFKKIHRIPSVYKRDMFIDRATGRTTGRNNPNAVQICVKGQPKKDKENNIIYEDCYISPKKYSFLSFHDAHDLYKKNNFFRNFKDKLTKYVVMALSKVLGKEMTVKKLRHASFIGKKIISHKTISYNAMINRLNIEFQLMQRFFAYEKAFEDEQEAKINFEHIFYSTITYLENGFYTFNKSMKLLISPDSKIKIEKYNQNLKEFEKNIKNRIMKWYYDEFYDPLCDDYYMETGHPFSRMKIQKY